MNLKGNGRSNMNFDYCNGSVYVIKQGDTLYSISRRYNVPLALILRANPYVDIYNLQIGDELCIPESQPVYPDNMPIMPGMSTMPEMTPENDTTVTPGMGTMPLPSQPSTSISPGMGTMPLPSQPSTSISPGMGAMPLPSQPSASISPGMGAMPLPSQPSTSISPEMGTMPRPTPSLPSGNQAYYQMVSYVIRDQDTLQSLLDYFDITLADVLRYNNLNAIQLKPGMTIQIPKKSDD